MAADAYLQIDGIKGESADAGHQGWIELTSVSWGVMQPTVSSKSTGGGHTAGHCEHRTLSVSKLADLASPILMQHCSMGKTIPKAKLQSAIANSASGTSASTAGLPMMVTAPTKRASRWTAAWFGKTM